MSCEFYFINQITTRKPSEKNPVVEEEEEEKGEESRTLLRAECPHLYNMVMLMSHTPAGISST